MANYATEFWLNGDEELQELARRFEQGISVIRPETVTSRHMCPCLDYTARCGFPVNGKVEYYSYRGEQLNAQ